MADAAVTALVQNATANAAPTATPDAPPNAMKSWMTSLPSMAEQAIAPTHPEPDRPVVTADKPADKAPEKTAEAKAEPAKTEEPPEEKWPRSAKDWDAFKSKRKEKEEALVKERDAIKTEKDALSKEIETLKKQGPSPELDGLKKERDALSERLRLVDVERHPKFQAYFENKTTAQLELAKRIVGTESAEAMVKALQMPDGSAKELQLEQLTSGLSMLKQSQLGSIITALDQIQSEKQQAINDAKTNYEEMTKSEKTKAIKQQQDQTAFVEKTFNDMLSKAQDTKEGSFLFQKRENDSAWNAEVDQRIAVAKQLFTGQSKPEQLAQASFYAAALPAMLQTYMKEKEASTKEIESLKAQVAKLTSANPNLANGERSNNGDMAHSRTPIKPGTSPGDVTRSWVKSFIDQGNQQA